MNLTAGRPPLNLTSESKLPGSYWGKTSEEGQVLVLNGELLVGVLDKNQFGASKFGLVHAVHEIYGPTMCGQLLTTLGRLFSRYLEWIGFTCRIDDLLLLPTAEARRDAIKAEAPIIGHAVATQFLNLEAGADRQALADGIEQVVRSKDRTAALDGAMKSQVHSLTSRIIDTCLPDGQRKPFPWNNMSLMVASGAKGSKVNFSQISCLLGQQELEGKRVPVMASGKTLPAFRAFDTQPRAGGYITNRFLSGIKPQEYFFHCMAGREGLIDTAVKTARSGYLQRCLIKHLEGLRVHYDYTVRDFDKSVIQFHYGEDSLDVTKQTYLEKFDFSARNYAALLQKYNPSAALEALDSEKAPKRARKIRKNPERYDPLLATYSPGTHLGVTSERFDAKLEAYLAANPCPEGGLLTEKKFRALMWLRYIHSLVEPGEAVGLLAGQSIGEPSTQMTLNTFHFAGVGAKNVTLGIPRLREIIMNAGSKIKTPSMTLPLRAHCDNSTAAYLISQLNRLVLSMVIDQARIHESVSRASGASHRERCYRIELQLIAAEELVAMGVSTKQLGQLIRQDFVLQLLSVIERLFRREAKSAPVVTETTFSNASEGLNGEGEGPAADEDEGDRAEKQSKRRGQKAGSDALDDDDDAGEDERSDGGDDETRARPSLKDAVSYEQDEEELPAKPEDARDESSDSDLTSEEEEVASVSDQASKRPVTAKVAPIESLETASDAGEVQTNGAGDNKSDLAARYLRKFAFDAEHGIASFTLAFSVALPKFLLTDLIRDVAESTVIREVRGITRCYQVEAEGEDGIQVATEGANFSELFEFSDFIDVNRLRSNDISAILRRYGVEAANAAIQREIRDVFKVYGISVDPRHLSLIADHMVGFLLWTGGLSVDY